MAAKQPAPVLGLVRRRAAARTRAPREVRADRKHPGPTWTGAQAEPGPWRDPLPAGWRTQLGWLGQCRARHFLRLAPAFSYAGTAPSISLLMLGRDTVSLPSALDSLRAPSRTPIFLSLTPNTP